MNLERANSGCLGDGSPGRGSGGRSPPEADDFSQLKGYLDVTSGILGAAWPPWPPLNPPVSYCDMQICWDRHGVCGRSATEN